MVSNFLLRTLHVPCRGAVVLRRTKLTRKLLPGVRHISGFTYVPDVAPPGTG